MILDSSVIVAIVLQEPGYKTLLTKIEAAPIVAVGAPTLVEATIVLSARLSIDGRPIVDELVREAQIEIVSFGADHFNCALDAYLRYGKSRHPAALNFGDCLAYAVSYISSLPLLFTGNDFRKTDVISA